MKIKLKKKEKRKEKSLDVVMVYVDASKEPIRKPKQILSLSIPQISKSVPHLPLPVLLSFTKIQNFSPPRNSIHFVISQLGLHRYTEVSYLSQSTKRVLAVVERKKQLWAISRRGSTGERNLSRRSFWQPHKIVKAITITLLAAVAAIKRPSRCIAVA